MSQACDTKLRYSIRNTISALEDISDVRVTATHARSYSLARREQRFAALLSVAGFILENESPDPVNPLKDDQLKSPPTVGMMINMEKLFEDYAFEMLKSGGGSFGGRFKIHDHKVIAQDHDRDANCVIRNRKPTESLFGLKPDLLFRDSKGRVALVADTKWKRISPPTEPNPASGEEVVKVGTFGIRQADVYQLFAYSEYFAEPKAPSNVVLIYPQDPRLEPAIGGDAERANNDINLTALTSVGSIDWEFCPRSRSEGKPAKLIIRLFPLPLLGAKHLPNSANPGPL